MSQRFGKEHKLKSKQEIDTLFKKGKRIHAPIVLLVHHAEKMEEVHEGTPRLLVSVPKRNFKKAVDRNLLKRRIRESYRIQLKEFEVGTATSYQCYFALVYKDTRIRDFNEIKSSITLLLRKLEVKNKEL